MPNPTKKTNQVPIVDDFKIVIKDNFLTTPSSGENSTGKSRLIVTVDATHGGYVNRNYYFYNPDAMRQSIESWLKPFPKPALIHHNDIMGEPIGRVISARFIDSMDKPFIQLDLEITDKDAIEKIMDGRYLTVSVSGRPIDYVKCSICGENLLTADEFCGHIRGQMYDTDEGPRLCYWEVGQLDYKEVSFVNVPADASSEHAAMVRSWRFADSLDDSVEYTINDDDKIVHEMYLMDEDDYLVLDDEEVINKTAITLLSDESAESQLMVHPMIWKLAQKESDDILDAVKAYANYGGAIKQSALNDNFWIPTEEELAIIDWLTDELKKFEEAYPEDDPIFDKMDEKTKKNMSKKSPEKFCGPMDPRKGRRSFPVANCKQARAAMRLLPKYKGPGNKERIKACIRRRAKQMGCPFQDQLSDIYEVLSVLEEFV